MGWLIFALMGGAVLLVLGLRGKGPGDDHPHCRRCDFDLFGKPAGSMRCAECGADLALPHAIRRGARKRFPGLMAVGALLIFASLAVSVWQIQVHWVTLAPYKPVWLLRREWAGTNRSLSAAALRELRGRISDGRLGGAGLRAIMEDALTRQADLTRTWDTDVGDLVESAMIRGTLEPDLRDAFLDHMLRWQVKIREKVRQGGAIPCDVVFVDRRGTLLASSPQSAPVVSTEVTLEIGGASDTVFSEARHFVGALAGGAKMTGTSNVYTPEKLWPHVGPGVHSGKLVALGVMEWGGARRTLGQSWPVELHVVPSDVSPVILKNDPALDTVLHKALRVTLRPGSGRCSIEVEGRPIPVDCVFRAELTDGTRSMASFVTDPLKIAAGKPIFLSFAVTGDAALDFTNPELILRPDPAGAERTIGINEIWGGELRFRKPELIVK